SVVLFDEIEKAHPDVFNILLQILDEGHLTDGLGRKVDFKNTVLILTSNIGARQINRNTFVGFEMGKRSSAVDYETMRDRIIEEVKRVFNPEFLNRVDEIVVFNQLLREDMVKIIDIVLEETLSKLVDRNIGIELSKGAKEFVADKGFDPVFGARPLKRTIQRYIEDPIAEELLKGRFTDGSRIRVKRRGDKLEFVEGRNSSIDYNSNGPSHPPQSWNN
ncbi:AAA family ATPase, partial [candidate division KSB1 bacterium]|nr:AAA family ATPase [candidate division KSB1 bacterium]